MLLKNAVCTVHFSLPNLLSALLTTTTATATALSTRQASLAESGYSNGKTKQQKRQKQTKTCYAPYPPFCGVE